MIIKGGPRANGGYFADYLSAKAGQGNDNDRVTMSELRGMAAETIDGFFRELAAVASGTNATNFFYHAHLNPDRTDKLDGQQWGEAVDILEKQLGFEGQPRIVVEHEKPDGRVHRHVIWSRIDLDSMTAIDCGNNFQKHERAARAIEARFDLVRVESVLEAGRSTTRPERRPQDWEGYRGQQSGIDPLVIKEELTEIWRATDSGKAFAAAVEERGYILAQGDRRDFVVMDHAGDAHSLARRLPGVKAADVRARMADLDRSILPSVTEARTAQQERFRDVIRDGADFERDAGAEAWDNRGHEARDYETRVRPEVERPAEGGLEGERPKPERNADASPIPAPEHRPTSDVRHGDDVRGDARGGGDRSVGPEGSAPENARGKAHEPEPAPSSDRGENDKPDIGEAGIRVTDRAGKVLGGIGDLAATLFTMFDSAPRPKVSSHLEQLEARRNATAALNSIRESIERDSTASVEDLRRLAPQQQARIAAGGEKAMRAMIERDNDDPYLRELREGRGWER